MSETVNQFKNRLDLDKFWSNQDLIYNYKAELTGVGNTYLPLLVNKDFQ